MPDETDRVRALEAQVVSLETEVARLREENRRWARLAGTDALTGLPNKISFLRAFVPQTFKTASEEQKSVGLLLVSPDDLGGVNEMHGREAGDQVLKGLGALIQSLIGDAGRLGLLDGSNFVLMVYPADVEDIRGRANMIRARVRTHAFPCAETTTQITVSAGVTVATPVEEDDLQALGEERMSTLSRALFTAKKAGGNRVEVLLERTESEPA
ncbi:MAG: hypothetical protein CME26_08290 [Gemmatimonadetes bacterium]|nr:hypothetical protein [Gemmatimonadota bacterium]|tara:strand:+ start:10158 stop:10796 length:639 start_codon:yes stop_codon:yes gene_type:complete